MFNRSLEIADNRIIELSRNLTRQLKHQAKTMQTGLELLVDNSAASEKVFSIRIHYQGLEEQLSSLDHLTHPTAIQAQQENISHTIALLKNEYRSAIESTRETVDDEYSLKEQHFLEDDTLKNVALSFEKNPNIRYSASIAAAINIRDTSENSYSLTQRQSISQLLNTYSKVLSIKELKTNLEENDVAIKQVRQDLIVARSNFLTSKDLAQLARTPGPDQKIAAKISHIIEKKFKIPEDIERSIAQLEKELDSISQPHKQLSNEVVRLIMDKTSLAKGILIGQINIQATGLMKLLDRTYLKSFSESTSNEAITQWLAKRDTHYRNNIEELKDLLRDIRQLRGELTKINVKTPPSISIFKQISTLFSRPAKNRISPLPDSQNATKDTKRHSR